MDLVTLLEIVGSGLEDRVLLGPAKSGVTGGQLRHLSGSASGVIEESGADVVLYLGGNGAHFAVTLFASAVAGVPFLPLNYRLSDEQLSEVARRHDSALVVTDVPERARSIVGDAPILAVEELMATASVAPARPVVPADPEAIAVLLMTSGTTAAPKAAVLRHRHLASYILGSVEFASADPGEATIVSVPPYHIAAIANLLSNLYAGRRIVYLNEFTPERWLELVRNEAITGAMVVPTMLARIVRALEERNEQAPATLRSLSYGGAKVSARIIEDALRLFPETGFVNAYGLTETSSSIAILGPEDHRDAMASSEPTVRARLGSAGRPLPGVEIKIFDPLGRECPPGTPGEIAVRGDQIAGEYVEGGSRLSSEGWFLTRDRGYISEDGYLFIDGRADDTIIRGGENIAPAEVEEAIYRHDAVAECAVAGIPDEEWGQRIAAFVVLKDSANLDEDELITHVRARLRSSKSPDVVVFLDELPTTATGKILRRKLVESLVITPNSSSLRKELA